MGMCVLFIAICAIISRLCLYAYRVLFVVYLPARSACIYADRAIISGIAPAKGQAPRVGFSAGIAGAGRFFGLRGKHTPIWGMHTPGTPIGVI